jgi:hypothetical protein
MFGALFIFMLCHFWRSFYEKRKVGQPVDVRQYIGVSFIPVVLAIMTLFEIFTHPHQW